MPRRDRRDVMKRRVALILLIVAAAASFSACGSSRRDPAKEDAVRAGIYAIKNAVFLKSGATDRTRLDEYPAPSQVSQSALTKYLYGYWPTNPYTKRPMAQGAGPGDYSYTLGDGGKSYELVGYGEGGKVVITVRGP